MFQLGSRLYNNMIQAKMTAVTRNEWKFGKDPLLKAIRFLTAVLVSTTKMIVRAIGHNYLLTV